VADQITQLPIEVLVEPFPTGRPTQVPVEVLVRPIVSARLTHVALEVLVREPPALAPRFSVAIVS
jgi:hypothetical protein